MTFRFRAPLAAALAGLWLASLAPVFAVAQAPTRREADAMQAKVAEILIRGLAPPGRVQAPLRTSFTERELNALLALDSAALLPAGVKDAQTTMIGDGRVAGRALVDLDALRKSKPRPFYDPMNLLSGSVEVKIAGVLRAANGRGLFILESASVGGIPVPKSVVQEMVAFYSKTPATPQGIDLDKAFALPHNIQSVDIQKGSASVVQ